MIRTIDDFLQAQRTAAIVSMAFLDRDERPVRHPAQYAVVQLVLENGCVCRLDRSAFHQRISATDLRWSATATQSDPHANVQTKSQSATGNLWFV